MSNRLKARIQSLYTDLPQENAVKEETSMTEIACGDSIEFPGDGIPAKPSNAEDANEIRLTRLMSDHLYRHGYLKTADILSKPIQVNIDF